MRRARSWRRSALAAVAALGVVWIAYLATAMRRPSDRWTADTGCESDPETVAQTSRVGGGSTAIRCERWDVGTGVAGYVWLAPEPRAALLLAHGWGDYAQRYARQSSELIPRLLERGISVYAFDMWGNGRSPGPRGASDIADTVEDHLAARRRLREQPLPVFLFGHSVGGLVTATSALRDPRDVEGMILVAPTLDWGLTPFLRFVARVGGLLLPTCAVPAPPGDPADQSRDAQLAERLARDPLHYGGSISWVTAGSGAATSHANWERYRHLTVPVLLVNGTADRVTAPGAGRKFLVTVSSADRTLRLVEGGRHALLDDPPSGAEALAVILEWLDRRLPQPAELRR